MTEICRVIVDASYSNDDHHAAGWASIVEYKGQKQAMWGELVGTHTSLEAEAMGIIVALNRVNYIAQGCSSVRVLTDCAAAIGLLNGSIKKMSDFDLALLHQYRMTLNYLGVRVFLNKIKAHSAMDRPLFKMHNWADAQARRIMREKRQYLIQKGL